MWHTGYFDFSTTQPKPKWEMIAILLLASLQKSVHVLSLNVMLKVLKQSSHIAQIIFNNIILTWEINVLWSPEMRSFLYNQSVNKQKNWDECVSQYFIALANKLSFSFFMLYNIFNNVQYIFSWIVNIPWYNSLYICLFNFKESGATLLTSNI